MSQASWLALADVPGLDGHRLTALLEQFGNVEALLTASAATLHAAGADQGLIRKLQQPDHQRLEAAAAWLGAAAEHHLISWSDPRYPVLLRQIPDPPVALFIHGNPACLADPQLAIVGSRNASPGGVDNARAFARHLAGCGLIITSGLALGIDAAAHAGALAGGVPTLAVLGTGPDVIYPQEHQQLAADIVSHGALCSEFLPGTPPRRHHFPRRNRIISGLALGTLVVEARLRSGALITAHCAAAQGREVFAIPGSIHNPLAKGCHRLIREGAKLVESGADILEELAPLLHAAGIGDDASAEAVPPLPAMDQQDRDEDYQRLIEALGWDPADIDTLALRSGLTPAELSSMLLILELDGSVHALAGGYYQRQR